MPIRKRAETDTVNPPGTYMVQENPINEFNKQKEAIRAAQIAHMLTEPLSEQEKRGKVLLLELLDSRSKYTGLKFHEDGTVPRNGEIFVFGSNLGAFHGKGAALVARTTFGARAPVGRTGGSYAIPTKDRYFQVLRIEQIKNYIDVFVLMTKQQDKETFFVTRVGCGLAGFLDSDIAPLFKGAKNCSFAESWRKYLTD